MTLPRRRVRDDLLPHVTAEAVASSLDGFSVSFLPGKDYDWLAKVIRRSMGWTAGAGEYSPSRMSNAEARQSLFRMTELVEATLEALSNCDPVIRAQLASYASMTATGDGPTSYGKMWLVVDELGPLSKFLREVTVEFEPQRGPWRQSERKHWRVTRAEYLAMIFETAFGEAPTANNYPSDARHKRPTAFMSFCERMLKLAFGAHEATNLSEVAKEACRLHRESPLEFHESFSADLGEV